MGLLHRPFIAIAGRDRQDLYKRGRYKLEEGGMREYIRNQEYFWGFCAPSRSDWASGIDRPFLLTDVFAPGLADDSIQMRLRREQRPRSEGDRSMSEYIADIRRYDAAADPAVVDKIVKHLGIALRNRDSSLVAAADPDEIERLRKNWVEKKLGVTDVDKGKEIVKSVAEIMKGDRNKQRVTFYYLTAKAAGKLASL
jgi:hypothetical protein